jgi:hypothetical protein
MFLDKYYPGYEIKKNGTGATWRVWKRGEVRGFRWINLEERDRVQGLGLAVNIILK